MNRIKQNIRSNKNIPVKLKTLDMGTVQKTPEGVICSVPQKRRLQRQRRRRGWWWRRKTRESKNAWGRGGEREGTLWDRAKKIERENRGKRNEEVGLVKGRDFIESGKKEDWFGWVKCTEWERSQMQWIWAYKVGFLCIIPPPNWIPETTYVVVFNIHSFYLLISCPV